MSIMTSTTSGSASPSSGSAANAGKRKLGPPVPKPNLTEYHERIEVGQKAISELHKKLDGLTARFNELNQGNSEFRKKRDDLRKNLNTIQQHMDTLEADRNRFVAEIEVSTRTGRDMKAKVQELKKSLGFQSSEEIDAKIRQIERHMMSKRLTVVEENKLIAEIQSLEQSKPLVAKYANMEVDANSQANTTSLTLRTRLDQIKDELKVCQQKKRDLNESFGALMQSRGKEDASRRELSDEKDGLKRQMGELRAQVNKARDEMMAKEREYNAYHAELERKTRQAKQEEQKRRDIERSRTNLQNQLQDIEEEAWSPMLQLTNQTVLYLRKLVEKAHSIEKDSAVDVKEEQNVPEAEDGMIVMKPKKDREEEYYYKPTKKKSPKKSKKPSVSVNQPLVHDISTLADFSRLQVEAPLTLQECPALLASLEERLEKMKKELSRASENSQLKRSALLAKLEALEESSAPAKAMHQPPVEIEAA